MWIRRDPDPSSLPFRQRSEVEAGSSDVVVVQVVLGQDERVVERVVLPGDGVDLEHGALVHPEELELVLGDESEVLGDLLPDEPAALVGGLPGSGDEEQHVALLGVHGGLDVLEDLGCEVLRDVGLQLAVLDPHPCESAEADLLGVVDVPVPVVPSDLVPGDVLLQVHSGDDAALFLA